MPERQIANDDEQREEFVRLLTGEQSRLFGYVATLLGNIEDAKNVLQQTNMVLWRKADSYTPGTNFHAWAMKTAYFQSLAYVRDRERDRHVFDETLIEQLAARPADADEDERRLALRHCLGNLSEDQLELVRQRYLPGRSIREIARRFRKTESAVKMALMRIRQALARCIETQLREHYEH